jgi:hypothetical protein
LAASSTSSSNDYRVTSFDIDRVARKLDKLERRLNQDERKLLLALFRLAGEQLTALQSDRLRGEE